MLKTPHRGHFSLRLRHHMHTVGLSPTTQPLYDVIFICYVYFSFFYVLRILHGSVHFVIGPFCLFFPFFSHCHHLLPPISLYLKHLFQQSVHLIMLMKLCGSSHRYSVSTLGIGQINIQKFD